MDTSQAVVATSSLFASRSDDVGDVKIHARTGGTGPPVVLVHGYGVSGRYLLPLARVLAARCAAYVPDLPGHGRSDQPPAAPGIPELAEALGAWLDVVGVERPALVASSM